MSSCSRRFASVSGLTSCQVRANLDGCSRRVQLSCKLCDGLVTQLSSHRREWLQGLLEEGGIAGGEDAALTPLP